MDVIRRVFRRGRRDDPFAPIDPSLAGPPPTELMDEPGGFTRRMAPVVAVSRYVGAAGQRLRRSPAFAPFSHLSVGLTYEGAVLKLLTCEGRRVLSWEAIPFDPRLISGTVVVEPYNLGRLVREAFDRRGLPTWRVHCALPAAGSLSRMVEVPRLGPRDRRRAVMNEAMRSLGVSPGRHYIYWQTVEEQADGQLVFVLAVPRDGMRSLIETMRAAGIRPRSVDITPLALARGVGMPDAIVLELDPRGVDLVVVIDEVPLLLRSVVFGEQALTLEEAQEAALELLTTELRRFEDVYVGSRVDRNVPIFLAGDLGAGLRLADRVRTATGHPLGRAAPMLDFPAEFPVADYLANAGLILKEG